ncbi:MAG: hypothetical protein ACRDNZ_02795 [Streptosporangiaceae bacterium]
MSSYTAICERAGRWWEITVPELDEVTQARRLSQVPATVASLARLMAGDDSAVVTMDVRIPADLRDEVARARQLREFAEAAAGESATLARDAARQLASDGLSVRDIGELLGVSYQRASQFTADVPARQSA